MEAVCRRRESFQPRGWRLRLSCKFGCEARRGFEKVSTISSRGSKSESSQVGSRYTFEHNRLRKETELPETQNNARNTRKKFLCPAVAKEKVSILSASTCNNITLKVEDDVVQR